MNFDMNQALGMGVKNDTQKNTIKKLLAFIVATLVVIASVGAIINGVHAVDNWMFGYDTVEVSYAETTHLVVEHHEGAVQKIVRAANNLKVSTDNKVDELLHGNDEIVAKAKNGHLLMGYTHQKGLLDYVPGHNPAKDMPLADSQTMHRLATTWGQENNVPTYWCGRIDY
ncbi:hypothetical protein DXA92_07265 [Agathobaculum butyriciproducens]|nr:hypothetical protein DXA94_04060 [Agathobaculum butyriciproducens]RGC61086.1 hypothetical protein DXA92_07265 [Agathobaculum butyriciproducens]